MTESRSGGTRVGSAEELGRGTHTVLLKPAEVGLNDSDRAMRSRNLSFGEAATEHMVTARWDNVRQTWFDAVLEPSRSIAFDPFTVGLHYGQVVFEGLKAFRRLNGSVALFRPQAHASRFRQSARRLMMPEMPDELFIAAAEGLVSQDQHWLSDDPSISLYLRPLMIASERTLALRPANEYLFLLVAFLTEGYFGRQERPIRVWVTEEYTRAGRGGTGAAKCAGNYGGSLMAQSIAREKGCDQVVWLDPVERRWIEEMGGMNLFFVHGEGPHARMSTPPLSDSLLPGVTRDTIMRLADSVGVVCEETPLSVRDWEDACRRGDITETFACGTAARITPVNEVRMEGTSWTVGDGIGMGDLTKKLLLALSGVQRGELADPHRWMWPVGGSARE